jgi:AcrR family transcriptional regulator
MPTPARTSREEIVQTARALLEQGGLDTVTMQGVARSVGVRAPSLYKHVRNRSDLVRLVVEDVASDLAATVERSGPSDDPTADLRAIAHAFRRFARDHPQAYGLVFANVPDEWRAAPESLARANEALLRTTAALAGEEHALEAARTVVAWAHGFVSIELAGAFRLGGSVDDAFAFGVERLGAALHASRPPA